jgi:hypothetical protein
MASISKDANGGVRLLFIYPKNQRHSIRLGEIDDHDAENHKRHVEELIRCARHGLGINDRLAAWVVSLGDPLYDKLVAAGLAPTRKQAAVATLQVFLDRYIEGRTDIEADSRLAMRQARASLIEFFGPDKPLRSITAGDAKDWSRFLGSEQIIMRQDCTISGKSCRAGEFLNRRFVDRITKHNFENLVRYRKIRRRKPYAAATIGRRIRYAKEFFTAAVGYRSIAENPFDKLK